MKIALVGTAPASRDLAPYSDPSWEIWGCSGGNVNVLPRVNIWFELHALDEMNAPENKGMSEPFYKWLREKSDAGTFQVVMQEFNPLVPKAIPFPRDEMIARFGHDWFTSSVAWMMALAISRMNPGDTIGLWGIDMAADQEHYTAQKAGCKRFIEFAREAGINITIPKESSIATPTPLYGYNEGTPFGRRINAVKHIASTTRAQLGAQFENLRLQIAFFDGALEQLKYFERTWTDGADLPLNLGDLAAVSADAAARYAGGGAGGAEAQSAPLVPSPLTGEPIFAGVSQPAAAMASGAALTASKQASDVVVIPGKRRGKRLNGAHAEA